MANHAVVTNMRTLRAMSKAGFIKLSPETGKTVRHWTGQRVNARYVDCGGPKMPRSLRFEWRGVEYTLKYFDGCFCPFVVRADATNLPSFA